MLGRLPAHGLADGEPTTDNGAPAANDNRSASPHDASSPGPDQPQQPGSSSAAGASGVHPPDSAYAHESAQHYHAAMNSIAQHQQLPPLPIPGYTHLPVGEPLPPHLQPLYGHPAPVVNSGTRPERRSRRKKGDNADGEDRGSEESGGEGDDSDEYVPDGTEDRSRRTRRGPNDPNDDGDDDGENDDTGGLGAPIHPQHIPHGMPPLPPDPHYGLSATQSLTTLGGSQSQSGPENSFVLGHNIDPNTGLPLPHTPGLSGDQMSPGSTPRGKRGRKHQNDEEWNRQRKDNHKEVERRRRGNINEGINQLAAIVPNSAGGEKAKGAILGRAVSYIHQLKDNEARNIEKWTLEKLLMDQAMGDLQGQLEEYKRRWEMEVQTRMALERELEAFKGRNSSNGATTTDGEVGQKRPRVE